MKSKVMIVAAIFWLVALFGGALSAKLQEYLRIWRTPSGVLEVRKLQQLYQAQQFQEVLDECDKAEHDQRYSASEPRILYLQWVADRRLGHLEDANRAKQQFLERFPNQVLGADMYFAEAVNLLAHNEYKNARKIFILIESHYSGSQIAKTSAAMRKDVIEGVQIRS
jgi:tetratricopeptide (TPR) repeat protein